MDVALRGEVACEMRLVRREDGASLDARGTTDMDEWSSCAGSVLWRGWLSAEFIERLLETLRRLGVELPFVLFDRLGWRRLPARRSFDRVGAGAC